MNHGSNLVLVIKKSKCKISHVKVLYLQILKECSKAFCKARSAVKSPYAKCFDPVTREKLNEIKIRCRQQRLRKLKNEANKLEKDGQRSEKDAYIAMHVRKYLQMLYIKKAIV